MRYIIIADSEGRDIHKLYINQFENNEFKLYVCGDMIDSTNVITDININEKSYNLRNILEVIANPNVILIFGNRDINKTKCKFVNKLNNLSNNVNITNFNEGNIELNYEAYLNLKTIIYNEWNSNNTKPWLYDMSNGWYPFWNPLINKASTRNKKNWNDNTNIIQNIDEIFLIRFNEIYGDDYTVGTMGAKNILDTIPNELGISKNSNNDYKAFIVLAVYNSMLEPKICITKDRKYFSSPNEKIINNCLLNSSFFNGWLYTIFLDKKNSFCKLLTNNSDSESEKDVFLLSHGGIKNYFLKKPYLLSNFKEALDTNENLVKILLDAKELWRLLELKEQRGGSILNQSFDNLYTINNSINTINTFLIDQTLKPFLDEDYHNIKQENIKNILMVLIYMLSLNYDKFKELLPDGYLKDDPILSNEAFKTAFYVGYNIIQQNPFFIHNINFVQIFGHKPIGYATTMHIEYDEHNNKSIMINLDTTNSFSTTNINTGKSKNFIIINSKTNTINMYSSINHNMKNIEFNLEHLNAYKNQDNSIHYVSKYNIQNLEINMTFTFEEINHLFIHKPEIIKFHGLDNDNYIFTINESYEHGFKKILFNLSPSEYVNLLASLDPDTIASKDKYKYLIEKSGVNKFLKKYLKYKKKYLKYKL